MKYVSTRGRAPVLGFDDVLLGGLASDGGLYVPETWPTFSREEILALRGLSYAEVAHKVIAPFMVGSVAENDLATILNEVYDAFDHPAVAPLRHLAGNRWLMELFHGPTLAFKDYALQVVGRLFDRVLTARGQRVTIVGATSGDTGSAAIEACRDRAVMEVFILFPEGRVSDVQRRQMTTVPSANVHCIALKGTFDDCQDAVKAMFADEDFRDEIHLAAVNSINWGRIMAQVAYYFWAGLQLGSPDRAIGFAVPTGNFGNVFAGWVAMKMGLPVAGLHIGSNRNDILTRFLETGAMTQRGVEASLSPSMDIQISSNFERLLFEVLGRDGGKVERLLAQFRQSGEYRLEQAELDQILALFSGLRLSDAETSGVIDAVYQATGELLDPHSAIGVAAASLSADSTVPVVILATAHPAKFPAAVEAASGIHPPLPARMADLYEQPERQTVLPNDLAVLKAFVRERMHSR